MESKTGLLRQSGLKKQLIWICIWVACFFLVGAVVSFIAEGQDYLRWVRTDNPYKQSEMNHASHFGFWAGGVIVAPFGVLAWGFAYGIDSLLKRIRSAR